MSTGHKPLRILHAVGPGDVVNSFRHWRMGEQFESETSIPYSAQYFSFCRDHGIETYVISSHPRMAAIHDGNFTVENRPKSGSATARGVRFHLREVGYGLSTVLLGVRYRADLVLIDSGTSYWFVFGLFRLFGIQTVNNFHNAFWPAGFPPRKRAARLIHWLDGIYLRWFGKTNIGVSPECQRQAEQLAGKPLRFFQYNAMYQAAQFAVRTSPDIRQRPFRIVFAGRVERNKGVFDILAMAEKLNATCPGEVIFELCGQGSAFEQISQERLRRGLEGSVVLHGKLNQAKLIEVYQRGHLVIIPTTSEFNEAFAMVAAEAVLLGRPVLSNPVVPACEVLAAATVLARTDDVDDYVTKVVELMSDTARYDQLCAACEDLRGRFVDPAYGIGGAVGKAIDFLRPGWRKTVAIQSIRERAQIPDAGNSAE